MPEQKQLTKEEAIDLAESGKWKEWSHKERASFQLFQQFLCMDFGAFHESVEATLCRPVFTHEFANPNALIDELLGLTHAPTLEQIIEMIPEEKRIVVMVADVEEAEGSK